MPKYSIGVDFGTLSGRALLVDIKSGEEIAVSVYEYPHGVMESHLPNGQPLPLDYALQHPNDYLDVFANTIPEVLRMASVDAKDVIGLGIDFTACTVLPIMRDGTPLCTMDEYKNERHAYVKLWKHHAAQDQANRLNKIAHDEKEAFIHRYGGKISSEWMIPKIMEIVEHSPMIYDAMDRFIEAADWVVMKLTGDETRNSCTAGYKALWSKSEGFPKPSFFKKLNPKLEHFVKEKIGEHISPIGDKAGEINSYGSKLTGLPVGTAVAIGNVDAHVSIPAVGIVEPGKLLKIMGTSTCDIVLGDKQMFVPGICGVVEDGVLPGFYGYEAGQSCVGDHFDWFVKNLVPKTYIDEAKEKNMDIHQHLTNKAKELEPGESGLVALDWWNGNRSILVDVDLTGLIIGMTLQTKPEEIYRTLIEATAYGARMIIETFEANGVPINEIFAAGGIVEKNAMMMQIYANVCQREIKISGSNQAPALGAAMFGAVAAGNAKGGYDSIYEAAAIMSKIKPESYKPNIKHVEVYNKLYSEYRILHDFFGKENNMMKRLKALKEFMSEKKNGDK